MTAPDDHDFVCVSTEIVERADGWWIEFNIEDEYRPERDVGPFASKALAQIIEKDFENACRSLGAMSVKGTS
jgi:hypothetical protein